jgi:A/G-specific adenine glycosylase
LAGIIRGYAGLTLAGGQEPGRQEWAKSWRETKPSRSAEDLKFIVDKKRLTPDEVAFFRQTVYGHFREKGRRLPWRETRDPYCILVSEIMLQQTQVERVLEKYGPFLDRFPDFASLAKGPMRDVLRQWIGLGYNRRAMALHRAARRIVSEFEGALPDTVEVLRTLPGIGPATAGALVAFAFNRPVVFIETNIRRVFIHSFFEGRSGIKDSDLLPLVEQTLDSCEPRSWYYALMDYGSTLKGVITNPNRRSAHHYKQAPFEGSNRQIRGLVLRTLVERQTLSEDAIVNVIGKQPKRVRMIIRQLQEEGFLVRKGTGLTIGPGLADEKP